MCIDISAVSNIITALATVVGVVFAIIEWQEHKKIRNAKLLLEFSNIFENNPAIATFIQKIDYGEKWYDNMQFHDSIFEKTADYALSTLCHYVQMIENNVIKERDFYALRYILRRTLENQDTQKYFKFLIGFAKRSDNAFPFEPLLRYGRQNHLSGDIFN